MARRLPQLTADQQALAARYLPMARAMARPYQDRYHQAWDDFASAAAFGLTVAAGRFNPQLGVKFSTYARPQVSWRLRDVEQDVIQANWSHRQVDPLMFDDLADIDDRPVGWELEAVDAVEGWIRKLPRQHGRAMRSIYLDGRTQADAAGEMGLSQTRVAQLHLQSLAMLRGRPCPTPLP